MLNKTTKRIMLGIVPMVAAIAPAISVVSCGGRNKGHDDKFVIGVRSSDMSMWNDLKDEFAKATGERVEIIGIGDQEKEYRQYSASGDMPDVGLADSTWSKAGIDKGWFQKIDLKDIAENPKYKITGTSEKYKEEDIKFDSAHFSMGMMNTLKTSDEGYNGMAIIYGPKISYSWKIVPLAGNKELNLYDGTKELKWYVPKGNGAIEEVSSFSATGKTYQDSPLFSKLTDHHRLKNTEADVQEFLSNAASFDDLKYNQATYDISSVNSTDTLKRVISTGNLGYAQRLASVSKVLYDYVLASPDKPAVDGFSLKAGVAKDAAIDWMTLAYGDKLIQPTVDKYNAATTNYDANNVLIDDKVFSKGPDAQKVKWDFWTPSGNLGDSHYQVLTYLGQLGYFGKGVFGTSASMGNKDLQDGFANFQSLMVNDGALWMWDGIKEKVTSAMKGKTTKTPDQLLTSFGKPFQNTGVDGYSVSASATGKWKDLAYKFFRFLMQKQVASEITGNKAVSTLIAAQALQAPIEGARRFGLDHAGVKTGQVSNPMTGVEFEMAVSSTTQSNLNGHDNEPIYGLYNNNWMGGTKFNGIDYTSDVHATYEVFKEAINTYNDKFKQKIEQRD